MYFLYRVCIFKKHACNSYSLNNMHVKTLTNKALQFCHKELDLCRPNPCMNGGTCSRTKFGGYKCGCTPGYDGTNCTGEHKQPDRCTKGVMSRGVCYAQASSVPKSLLSAFTRTQIVPTELQRKYHMKFNREDKP